MKPKVCIYTTTYRNEEITKEVIKSYLKQTYENIEVHVYDNGLAEGFDELCYFIEGLKNPKVNYHSNSTQIGHRMNYGRIFSELDSESFALILASDMGLAPNAVERMLTLLQNSNSQVTYSNYINYDISCKPVDQVFSFESYPYEKIDLGLEESCTVDSVELIKEYFSPRNIKGEFNGFSLFGALFDSRLLQNLPPDYLRFAGHGAEHFLSMILLMRSSRISLCSEHLILNVFGRPRIGGTQRIIGDIYRIDTIVAAQAVIDDYYMHLTAMGLDIDAARLSQIEKAKYFQKNYSGFNFIAQKIIDDNKYFFHSN
jgi:glycosyltransferase involved in cell wall biosynthesis